MQKILQFFSFIFFLALINPFSSHAEIVNEDFTGWTDGSYGGIYNYTDGNGGMWESNNSLVNSSNACGVDALRFNDDSGANEYVLYSGIDGNGKDVGIGTISFDYRHWDGDGSDVSFQVEYNQAGAGWTAIGAVVSVTSTTCMTFSEVVNLPGDDILIRIRAVTDEERLLISDLLVTEFSAPAPITLSDFTAAPKDEAVTLSWTTLSEENNDFFSIEHSTDGINYTEIDYVKGAGTSYSENNYEYTHRNPAKGANYYRLMQVDYNRNTSYSPVEVVEFTAGDLFTIRPTLTKGEVILSFDEDIARNATIEVFDLVGKRVLAQQITGNEANFSFDASNFQNGHYLVRMQAAGQTQSARFVKF